MGKQSRSNRPKPTDIKNDVQVLVAKYGLIGVIIASIIGMVGVIIAAYVGYLSAQTQVFGPIQASQTAEAIILLTPPTTIPPVPTASPTQRIVEVTPASFDSGDLIVSAPTIGAQLDFSPKNEVDIDWFRRSPFDGIFMSKAIDYRYAPSWYAVYDDKPRVPAEAGICLMNIGPEGGSYSGVNTGPLNIKTSRINIIFSIYSDYRYTLEIKDIDVLIADFLPMKTDIQLVQIGEPGAGGWSYPFQDVQAMKVWVDGISNTVYKMDFTDFVLAPNNGVNVAVPIAMADPGKYIFIFKVNGIAVPTYAGEPAGEISLTSNVVEYEWVLLNDPRDFAFAKLRDFMGNVVPIELIPCP